MRCPECYSADWREVINLIIHRGEMYGIWYYCLKCEAKWVKDEDSGELLSWNT